MDCAKITHVIFDLGGIILDHAELVNSIFDEYAHNLGKQWKRDIDFREIDASEISHRFRDFLVSIGMDSCDMATKINELTQQLYSKFQSETLPMVPGVKKLIDHLYEHNIPMAIATNGRQRESAFMLNIDGYDSKYFSHVVSGGDDPEVKNNKPAPDVYLVCAKRFKIPVKSMENCVIFEDSVRGITGAVSSGMRTVLVNSRTDLDLGSIRDKITVTVDSFHSFKPESVGLPPYL